MEQFQYIISHLDLILCDFDEYTIENIYYDTNNFDVLRTSLDKPFYKEKFRVRHYKENNIQSNDVVFFEIKKKLDGIVYKNRVEVPKKNFNPFNLSKGVEYIQQNNEIKHYIKSNYISPKIYIQYDRKAYTLKDDKNIRITFDTNIMYSMNKYNFENSFCNNKKNVFDKNVIIMEVKSNNNLPLNMCTLFNDLHLFPTSFSKVGEVYKKILLEKEL